MGALCLQAAVFGCFLPETKSKPTLETMNDINTNPDVALLVNGEDEAGENESDTEL